MSKRYERDHQNLGRMQVYMQGDQVAIKSDHPPVVRILEADEALKLLGWLQIHKDELYKISHHEGSI